MKKERIILFLGYENVIGEQSGKYEILVKDFWPGKTYRIGKPSNGYYQYIHPVIEPSSMSVNDFEDFRIIEGMVITVTSILRMSGGNSIAVLRRYDDIPFIGKVENIFAHVDMGIISREIIPLNLEKKRDLELAVIAG